LQRIFKCIRQKLLRWSKFSRRLRLPSTRQKITMTKRVICLKISQLKLQTVNSKQLRQQNAKKKLKNTLLRFRSSFMSTMIVMVMKKLTMRLLRSLLKSLKNTPDKLLKPMVYSW
jgi:hypothetical protein